MEKIPQKIVSLVPSFTETLYELGLEHQIVGITHFCKSPFHFLSTKKIVTTDEGILYDEIKALNPDLILVHTDDYPAEIVTELQKITKVFSSDVSTFDGVITLLETFGKLFHKNTDANKWIEKIKFAKNDFDAFMKDRPQRKAAYLLQKSPYISVNKQTYIHEMLTLNHLTNIYAENTEKYPTIEIRKIRIQGDPELVLLPSTIYEFTEEDVFEIGRCTHHAKTIFIDGEMFSWFGTRIYRAFEYFKQFQLRLDESSFL